MTGKGAPQGNQYARKGDTGKTISLYLSGDDMTIIRQILVDRGEDASDAACVSLAKKAAKSGVYQLVIAKKSEDKPSLQEALRETINKFFAMVYYEQ